MKSFLLSVESSTAKHFSGDDLGRSRGAMIQALNENTELDCFFFLATPEQNLDAVQKLSYGVFVDCRSGSGIVALLL